MSTKDRIATLYKWADTLDEEGQATPTFEAARVYFTRAIALRKLASELELEVDAKTRAYETREG
jgi:hypothetical protein